MNDSVACLAPDAVVAELARLLSAAHAEVVGEHLRALCQQYPQDARLIFYFGVTLHRRGDLLAALEAFSAAIALDPFHEQALCAKAMLLRSTGRSWEAEQVLVAASERLKSSSLVLANLGVVREERGDLEGALTAYDASLERDSRQRIALMNRGSVLTAMRRIGDALENNRRLVEAFPGDPTAHYNLAEVLLAMRRFHEAVEACDKAISLNPLYAKAYIDRALAASALGQMAAAQRDLDHARILDAEAVRAFNAGFAKDSGGLLELFDARSLYLHMLCQQVEACDWSRREELILSLETLIHQGVVNRNEISDPNLPFRTLSLPLLPTTRLALVKGVARGIGAKATIRKAVSLNRVRRKGGRIRLGYVSPDFRVHPAAYLTRHLYEMHDRTEFEVYAYSLFPDDGSEVRRHISQTCDVFRDLAGRSGKVVAENIREDEVDIAIDLSGYTNFTDPVLFAHRPASVQVNYLGFPSTLGADFIDYAIVDHIVCPSGADEMWSEKLIRMPHTYFITNNKQVVDSSGMSRASLGLPESAFVFCSFNNPYKIDPGTFDVWMSVLRTVTGSVLWVFATKEDVKLNLAREAAIRGVDPSRLVYASYLPHERHLGRYAFADLFLDTRYYNAHTTAVDALWSGVPVLTVPGDTMPSRVGASLLRAAGLPEMICKDWTEYQERAVWLATHPDELATIKMKLAANRSSCPLFDTEARVRQLEAAFAEMWRRHLAGLSPASFEVQRQPKPEFRNRWH